MTTDNPNINLQWGVSAVEGDVIEQQGNDLHLLRFLDGLDNVPIFTWNPDDFEYGDTFIISAKIEIDAYDELGSETMEYNYVHILPIEIEFREYYTAGDMNDDGMWNILDIVAVATCVMNNTCSEPQFNPPAGDVNSDGAYNVLDIVELVNCVITNSCGEYS